MSAVKIFADLMAIRTTSLDESHLQQATALLNRRFSDYLDSLRFTAESVQPTSRRESTDLALDGTARRQTGSIPQDHHTPQYHFSAPFYAPRGSRAGARAGSVTYSGKWASKKAFAARTNAVGSC